MQFMICRAVHARSVEVWRPVGAGRYREAMTQAAATTVRTMSAA